MFSFSFSFSFKHFLITIISISILQTTLHAASISTNTATTASQPDDFTADVTLTSSADMTLGAITTSTSNQGTLDLNNAITTATIGSTGTIKALNIIASTTTLGGAVSATTTTVTSGATLNTATNNLTGILINDGTVTLGSGAVVSGAITNTGILNLHDTATNTINGAGTINSAETHTTTSIIGGSTATTALNITANTFTLGAAASVTTTTVSSGATLATGSHILTGAVVNNGTLTLGTAAITGAISGTGTVDVIEDYTAGAAIGATNLNISATKTLNLNAAASIITGTTTINESSASIISNKNTDLGNVVIVNAADSFVIGTTYTLVEMTGSDLTVGTITGPTGTVLIPFTTTTSTDAESTDKITVIRDYAESSVLSLSGNNANTYTAATTATITNDTAIYNAMNAMSATEIDAAVDTMHPNTNGVSAGTVNVSNYSVDTVSDHLTLARAKISGSSGISTGDESLDDSVWVQGFYTDIRQDDRGGVSGYDAESFGLVMGIDHQMKNDSVIFGIALSLGKSNVKSKNTTTLATTDTDSVQVMAYVTKSFSNFYLESMLSYAINSNEGARHVVVGAIDRIAEADYKSHLMAARIGIGVPIKKDGFTLLPKASINYVSLSTDTYTETGASSLNLTVNTDTLTKYTAKVGMNVSREIHFDNGGTLTPELRTGLSYDMGDDFSTSTSSFEGGGNAFDTNGLDAEDLSVNGGLGLSYLSESKLIEFNINYDVNAKADYLEQVGLLTLKYKF